jgi:ATP-dependent RNA helicase DeaD
LIGRLMEEGFTSTDIASACLAQLQSGEAAPTPAPAPRAVDFDRPERPERERFRDDPRERRDDRRVPRYESRERFERPQRFADRREIRPPRVAAPVTKLPRQEKLPAAGAPVPAPTKLPGEGGSAPARHFKIEPPRQAEKPVVPMEVKPPATVKPEVQKTFSDQEILSSLKPQPRKTFKPAPKPVAKTKPSRATPPDQTRLWMNLGQENGVVPIDIVNAVAGETGLPGKVVGTVDVRERHLFMDVAAEHASGIIAKLNRASIKGIKVKVKVA